jgi:hypothetical protein
LTVVRQRRYTLAVPKEGVIERGPLLNNVGGGLRGHAFYRVRYVSLRGEIALLTVTLVKGSYRVTELRLPNNRTTPITTERLRTIPLRTIVDLYVGWELENLNVEAFDIINRPILGDAELRTALVYRLARLLGEAPVKAVMNRFGVSRSTATRRVAEAREKGFLGAYEVGQAGGVRSTRTRRSR